MASSINASTSGAGGVITTADNSGILNLQSNGTTVATVSPAGFSTPTGQTINTANTFGFKNRLINGNFTIDQYNAGASITPTSGQYVLDRWFWQTSPASKFTFQQNAGSVTPPAGFINYAGFTSTSAYTIGAGDYFLFQQKIEGLNVADLGWGTANAKTVTVSAWVRSSLTGTFGGVVLNSAANRWYVFSYTISAANTWQQISITIPGDTSGTWLTTNGIGLWLRFCLGVDSASTAAPGSWSSSSALGPTGQVNVAQANGATWYITGVQLEVGSQATSFDFRDYGRELILCQRYYQKTSTGIGVRSYVSAGAGLWMTYTTKVSMRTTPTLARFGTWTIGNCGQPDPSAVISSTESFVIAATASGSGDTYFYTGDASTGVTMSAEL